MSRKIRTPKTQVLALPSPAWTLVLLTGQPAPCRITGWAVQAQAGLYGDPTADQVWEQHREALIAEAQAHEFEPYAHAHRTPTGPGFQRWCEAFLAAHRY